MVVEKDSSSSSSSRRPAPVSGRDSGLGSAVDENVDNGAITHADVIVSPNDDIDDDDDQDDNEKEGLIARRKPKHNNTSDATVDVRPSVAESGPQPQLTPDEQAERKRQEDDDRIYSFIWQEMKHDRSFYLILAIAAVIEGSQSMSSLALQYLLKDDLQVTPSMQSILFGIVSIPWVIKPMWGFISDAFPILGYHRRSYLAGGAAFACFMWVMMALQTELTYIKIMFIMLGVEIGHAVLSTVAKALLVEHCEGREQKYASFLQTYYHVFLYSSSLIFAFMGGYTLTHGVKKSTIFGVTAVTPGIGAIVALFVQERPPSGLTVRQQLKKLWEVIRYPQPNQPYALWRPMLFMVLFSMGPNSGTAMFYFFTEKLGFNPQFISYMNMISTLFALIGVILYQKYFSDVPHRTILCYGMLLTVSFAMLPILVVTRVNIQMGIPDQVFMLSDKAITAAVSRIGHIPVLIMGAQLCPPGIEGTLYATMMSMLNFGAMLAEHNTAFVMWLLNVKKSSYDNLPWLITICCSCAIAPLLLLNTLLPYGGDLPQDGSAAKAYHTKAGEEDEKEKLNGTNSSASDEAKEEEEEKNQHEHDESKQQTADAKA